MGAAVALAAAGCSSSGGGSGAAPSGPPEKPNITVAAVPTLDEAGLYIAQMDGLFAKQGLNVKIVPIISSEKVIQQQVAGQGVDISAGNYVSYIQAAANPHHPAKLRIIAAGSVMAPNVQMLMVPANSKLTNPAQLVKHVKVGVNVVGNIGSLLIDSMLNNNAAWPPPPNQGPDLVPIPFPNMVKALQAGQVQAAWLPEPFVTIAEETIGAQPMADMDAGTTQNLPIGGYVATQAWVKKYPNTEAAFLRALRQGQEIASTNSGAVYRSVIRFAHVPAVIAPITQPPNYPLTLDPASIQRIANLMLQFNLLQQGFNTSSMTG